MLWNGLQNVKEEWLSKLDFEGSLGCEGSWHFRATQCLDSCFETQECAGLCNKNCETLFHFNEVWGEAGALLQVKLCSPEVSPLFPVASKVLLFAVLLQVRSHSAWKHALFALHSCKLVCPGKVETPGSNQLELKPNELQLVRGGGGKATSLVSSCQYFDPSCRN